MFAAGVGYSPNEFQSDRDRFANLLSLKPSTTVHVDDNPLKGFLGAREVGMFTVRL
jgi:FMN phosphatase YigB (HAD superfamily)